MAGLDELLYKADSYKAEIDKKRPFKDIDSLKKLQDFYRVDFTYTSNALEGNSLSLSETKVILEDGITVGGKPLKDIYEAVGHALAYDYMFSLVQRDYISVIDICKMHELFYSMIDSCNAGKLRKENVYISGSRNNDKIPEHVNLPAEMGKLEGWLREDHEKIHPVLFAAELHVKLIQIHPFIDGNGRICRLVMNMALVQNGYPPAIIPPVIRAEYIETLESSWINSQPFYKFIAQQVIETEKDLMRMLRIPLDANGNSRGSARFY